MTTVADDLDPAAVERAALVRLLEPGIAGTWLTPSAARRVQAALAAAGPLVTSKPTPCCRPHLRVDAAASYQRMRAAGMPSVEEVAEVLCGPPFACDRCTHKAERVAALWGAL